jgi:hypothetical protein
MKNALKRHDAILRDAVASSNGPVVKRTGPWGVHANPVWAAFEGAGPREALDGCLGRTVSGEASRSAFRRLLRTVYVRAPTVS